MRLTRTLRGQLLLRVTAVVALMLALLTGFQYNMVAKNLRVNAAENIRRKISPVLSRPMGGYGTDYAGLARSLTGPGTCVAILSEDRKVLATSGSVGEAIPAAMPANLVTSSIAGPPSEPRARYGERPGGEARLLDSPPFTMKAGGETWLVVPTKATIGSAGPIWILVAQPTREIDENLAFLATLATILGISGLLVAVAVAWPLVGSALRPLRNLVDTAGAIADGDWDRRVPHGGSEEIDRAAGAFNQMVDRLQIAFAAEQEQHDRMRRFVADAAHELRTPLTAMNGFLEIMQAGAISDPVAQRKALGTMRGEGQRMARMVSDLLTIARLDAHHELPVAGLDVGEMLQNLLPALQAADQHKPVTLSVEGQTPIIGYADGLKQVVWNLVDNARRYSPEGAEVAIACHPEGQEVVLSVADRGSGIPEKDLPQVFDRFWRGDPSRTRQSGGAGLGLSIVKSMIEAHEGTVSVTSEVGKGTTFQVRIPLRRGA